VILVTSTTPRMLARFGPAVRHRTEELLPTKTYLSERLTRNALEAGRKAFGPDDRFELPRPGILKSDSSGCSGYSEAADGAYAAAAEAAFSGSHAKWVAAMQGRLIVGARLYDVPHEHRHDRGGLRMGSWRPRRCIDLRGLRLTTNGLDHTVHPGRSCVLSSPSARGSCR
jgi:hypothetical protein